MNPGSDIFYIDLLENIIVHPVHHSHHSSRHCYPREVRQPQDVSQPSPILTILVSFEMLNKISIFDTMKMFLIILLVLPFELSSQNFERLTNNEYGFAIDKPRKWVMWEMQEIKNNFPKFDFTAKEKRA